MKKLLFQGLTIIAIFSLTLVPSHLNAQQASKTKTEDPAQIIKRQIATIESDTRKIDSLTKVVEKIQSRIKLLSKKDSNAFMLKADSILRYVTRIKIYLVSVVKWSSTLSQSLSLYELIEQDSTKVIKLETKAQACTQKAQTVMENATKVVNSSIASIENYSKK